MVVRGKEWVGRDGMLTLAIVHDKCQHSDELLACRDGKPVRMPYAIICTLRADEEER